MRQNAMETVEAELFREGTARLPVVPLRQRADWLALPATRETHRRLAGAASVLRMVETGGTAGRPATTPLRVVYWNAERFRHFEPCCALIRQVAPDVLLLGEFDIGMARSGQRHAMRD